MHIAIPTFGTRVSPRFDCAKTVLLVHVDDGNPSEFEQIDASDWAPHTRINKLLELKVEAVICGGIDCWSAESLQSANVAVLCGVTGKAQDALEAFLQGNLTVGVSLGPGRQAGSRYGRQGPGRSSEASQTRERGLGRRCGGRAGRGRGGRGNGATS
jgi:predicted Fe-Mo cluster-binding NifX family protein